MPLFRRKIAPAAWPVDTSKLWCGKSKYDDDCGTTKVGSFPSGASPYGVVDMAGNVWQWCDNSHDNDKYDKAVRGGWWGSNWGSNSADDCRFACRGFNMADYGTDGIGFCCLLLKLP